MTMLPDLSGHITKENVKKKGRHDFVDWSTTKQILREHAPDWVFNYSETKQAPDGSGFIEVWWTKIDSITATPRVPYACMDNSNKPISYEKVSARILTDTHRRAMCFAAAWDFGLAYELWAGIDPLAADSGITVDPKRATGAVASQPVKRQKDVAEKVAEVFSGNVLSDAELEEEITKHDIQQPDLEAPLDDETRHAILQELTKLYHANSNAFFSLDEQFRKKFKYKGSKFSDGIAAVKHSLFINDYLANVGQ